METTKQILDKLLIGNEKQLAELILSYITDKCDCCDELNFVTELEDVEIPKKILFDDDECKKHGHHDHKHIESFCSTCVEEQCCKGCDEYACNDCSNRYECDYKYCSNIFCEDCKDEDLLWCSQCEERFCCRKVYKTIGPEGDYIFSCESCIEVIHPKY